MSTLLEGKLDAHALKFAVVLSRFNDFICERLLHGALDALIRSGADENDIDIVKVPGSFEIPQVAMRLAKSKKFDAVICLGTVIRGATPHFDFIASEVAKAVA